MDTQQLRWVRRLPKIYQRLMDWLRTLHVPQNEYQRIKYWIKTCDRQHKAWCQPTPVECRPAHQVPAWVIDTQNACIVPGSAVSRYAALSYVWPNNQENMGNQNAERLVLLQSNLADFQKPGFLNKTSAVYLPRVVRDTIDLVTKLGERYLWVDCLCIVQKSQQTREQVDRMDHIYSGAYFTVIAAASYGLYSRPAGVEAGEEGSENRTDKESVENLYFRLYRSKWATRGWTFQEQILSKRAIIFIDGDVFWDCQCSVWANDTSFSNDGPYYEMARRMSSITWPDFSMYIELVSLYNDRDLTFPQDAIPAFSGVLNSFTRTFLGSFVQGLPRLFLDMALLWQPFSKARRRSPKDSPVASSGHLPSWSWCGWQCPVDPYSFRTGLAYLENQNCKSRVLTWRTQRLVRWSVLSGDMQLEEPVDEPALFESYRNLQKNNDCKLPQGWSRHEENPDGLSNAGSSQDAYFTHKSDGTTRFKHPIPICEPQPSPASLYASTYPFLSCEATRAFFCIQSILKPDMTIDCHAAVKISVFELPQFTNGPEFGNICHVLCLEDAQGRPAGLLRQMDDTEIEPGGQIELIAISSGSVSRADLMSSFEEKVNSKGIWSYRNGLTTVQFNRFPPGEPFQESTNNNETMGDYHFYNVLWIERKGDIAYRRAAGRVSKEGWDQSCPENVRVVLG